MERFGCNDFYNYDVCMVQAIITVGLKSLKWLDGLEWIGSIDINGSIAGNP